ncbi:hypothetical protein AQUCO_01400222v1 [Aquilegia coerulea]|uniref:Filament-like plant protein n=1 Tax=Aquilegia coerulea TaxID=218851 RepID=A0A2G5DV88_AQUCA|nr:hypothetical protein AQUCO_01400222v1 [Aquilegia coerulea]PIA47405.1 hypothetical protein AQUCO_01400222v1 [Aquilegia coerulea]
MDRKSWLWRRKSSEKSPGGETESSGSMSSHSELYSDDQEGSRGSPSHNAQSPEVTSKAAATNEESNDNLKSLREKLSAALINISAKEDLVKQHSKVAEEAVSGWEKAENEGAVLKQQLEAAARKNLALEDRLGHLDGALKECLRELRQAREEQEQKIREAVVKNTREWESMKLELEAEVVELQNQVDAAKAGDAMAVNSDLLLKLEATEKQKSALKLELRARVDELERRTLERDLSTETAETASKQHLESIKKAAKLEAECRRLRAMARKAPSANDHKFGYASSLYVESLTDSQSDSGERLLTLEADNRKMSSVELNGCEPSCSDSWASALIVELDQFKNEKVITKNLTSSSMDIDLMDDFLEMERLAALPQIDNAKHDTGPGISSDQHNGEDCQHKADLEAMSERMAELEKKLVTVEVEKAELEMALAKSHEQLEISQNQLRGAEYKLVELQRQLEFANDSNLETEAEIKVAIVKREVMESQLIAMDAEVRTLRSKVGLLETQVEEERALSAEITAKCKKLEDELSVKRREANLRKTASSNGESKIKQEKELAAAAGKLAECQKTIASLGQQLKSLATLEDFMIDSEHSLEFNGGALVPRSDEIWKSPPSSSDFVPERNTDALKTTPLDGSGPSLDGKLGQSPQSSSSSTSSSTSSSSVTHAVASEKSRNGFGKLFSRSKTAIRLENQ